MKTVIICGLTPWAERSDLSILNNNKKPNTLLYFDRDLLLPCMTEENFSDLTGRDS